MLLLSQFSLGLVNSQLRALIPENATKELNISTKSCNQSTTPPQKLSCAYAFSLKSSNVDCLINSIILGNTLA